MSTEPAVVVPSSPSPPQHPAPAAGRLLVLTLGTFAIGTDSFVIAGVLPEIARSLDVGIGVAGQLVTAYALTYALLTPVLAAATGRWRRERVLTVGLGVFVVGNVLTAVAAGFALAVLGRCVAGLGAALFTPAASAAAASLVAPERRGRALAIVLAGLSGATALGAPLGTLVGSLGDWRATLWLVSVLGALAGLGVAALLPALPAAVPLRLRERLAPLRDARVATTLATTALVMLGVFLVYTYISLVFGRVTRGDGATLAALMAVWGVAATVGNLVAGSLSDRVGPRRVLGVAIGVTALDFALMPWTSAHPVSAVLALGVWGVCGWGTLVAQQHRLVGLAPTQVPLVLALNSSATYAAVAASGVAGAVVLTALDASRLPWLSAALLATAALTARLSERLGLRARSPAAVELPVRAPASAPSPS